MSKPKVNSKNQFLLLLTAFLILIILSFINLTNIYYQPESVLGTDTESENQLKFWSEYLKYNPSYVPGWIEVGRTDKAFQIDPNYQIINSFN